MLIDSILIPNEIKKIFKLVILYSVHDVVCMYTIQIGLDFSDNQGYIQYVQEVVAHFIK